MLPRRASRCLKRLGVCKCSCTATRVRFSSVNFSSPFIQRLAVDASDFLRKHPWPGRSIRDTFDDSTHRTGKLYKRFLSAIKVVCGKTGDEDENNDLYDFDEERMLYDVSEDDGTSHPFYWSTVLQQSFREELEKYAHEFVLNVNANFHLCDLGL